MIEIKNRYNDEVLYVARDAKDVRTALEEAAKKGANLGGAYLRGANLRGANLGGAYLRGANLRGANLEGANLGGANLEGAYLGGANLRGANLRGANLEGAYLEGAYLGGTYLEGANLVGAYLEGAYLEGAYLRGANLRGANLEGANLRGAKGLNPHAVNNLLILADQIGKIRAYKVVEAQGYGPFNGGIKYEVGKTYKVRNANCNPEDDCGAGINVATLPWCIKNWQKGRRILLLEFTAKDIAAIPIGDGKFRVKAAKVVRELDLKKIGLET